MAKRFKQYVMVVGAVLALVAGIAIWRSLDKPDAIGSSTAPAATTQEKAAASKAIRGMDGEGVSLKPADTATVEHTAMLVTEDDKSGWHRVSFPTAQVTAGIAKFTITAKARDRSKLFWDFYDGSNKYIGMCLVDLRDGKIVPQQPSEAIVDVRSEDLGDGWYRFYATVKTVAGESARHAVGLADPDSGLRSQYQGAKKEAFIIGGGEISQ